MLAGRHRGKVQNQVEEEGHDKGFHGLRSYIYDVQM
ncbi:hypothetical protein LINPERHAP2_LOCUS35069 [Linum perenne]